MITAAEHLLLLGPPGTAKSALCRRVSTLAGLSYFERTPAPVAAHPICAIAGGFSALAVRFIRALRDALITQYKQKILIQEEYIKSPHGQHIHFLSIHHLRTCAHKVVSLRL